MPRFLEETLNNWRKPPSDTEETKLSNIERMVKGCINADDTLKSMKIKTFGQGSYANDTNVRLNSDVDLNVKYVDGFYFDPLYCLRFFRPLPKGRLCYTNNLIERSIQWRNEEPSRLSLKRKLFSKSSAVRLPKQKCVGGIISTKINSHSGSDSCLKMRHPCLSLWISSPARSPRSVSLTLSSSLGEWPWR